MKEWKCSVCGYVHTGDSPPEECPVCGADKSLFKPMAPDNETDSASMAPEPAPAAVTGKITRWRCTVCGYVHTGDAPPEKCPVCGADQSMFVPIEEPTPEQHDRDEAGPRPAEVTPEVNDKGSPGDRLQHFMKQKPYDVITQRLTQLHGHPIAVHIPNGLLPISVLFAFLAILFGSEGFATAARYNTCLVALAMPLVIITGLIDWINRYNGRISRVFRIKMGCAAVVTLLSITIAIWWIAAPDLITKGIISNLFFLLLNFANLAAAVVAGWYGGKLVFLK